MKNTTAQRCAQCLSVILNREVDEKEDVQRQDQPDWDSLKHIELIVMLEDEFGIRFRADDLSRMNSLSQINDVVEEIKHNGS